MPNYLRRCIQERLSTKKQVFQNFFQITSNSNSKKESRKCHSFYLCLQEWFAWRSWPALFSSARLMNPRNDLWRRDNLSHLVVRAVHCPAGVQGHRVHQSWLHLRGDACSLFHGCSHVPRPPGDVTQVSPCILQGVFRPHHLVSWSVHQICVFLPHCQHSRGLSHRWLCWGGTRVGGGLVWSSL